MDHDLQKNEHSALVAYSRNMTVVDIQNIQFAPKDPVIEAKSELLEVIVKERCAFRSQWKWILGVLYLIGFIIGFTYVFTK